MADKTVTDLVDDPADSAGTGASLVEEQDLVEEEILVEEISIDGMCGVY